MSPLDTWRICGRRIDRGCTCKPNDPTPDRAAKALARMAAEQTKEDTVPHAPHAARRAAGKAVTP